MLRLVEEAAVESRRSASGPRGSGRAAGNGADHLGLPSDRVSTLTDSEREWLLEQMAARRKRPARPPAAQAAADQATSLEMRPEDATQTRPPESVDIAPRATPGFGDVQARAEEGMTAGGAASPAEVGPASRSASREETADSRRPRSLADSFWSFG